MAVNSKFNIQTRETKKRGIVYDVYFYDCGKQKKLSGFKTKTAAKTAYMDYIATSGRLPNGAYAIVLYEDARRLYLQAMQSIVKESSLYDFIHTGARYYDVFFKNKNLMKMTKQDVFAFQDWIRSLKKADGSPYAPKTQIKIYEQFTAFYNWCVPRYDCPDVLNGVSFQVRKTQKKPYDIYTPEEFESVIANIDDPKYVAMLTLLYYGGMRVGELQARKVSDFNGSSLYIHTTLSKKTLDGSSYKITDTKNYRTRYLPLSDRCIAALRPYVENRKKDEFIFGGAFGGDHPISLNAIRYSYDKAIEAAGVKRIRIHDLRHSFASLLLAKGVNPAVVAELIGDSLKQVVETYGHAFRKDVESAVSVFN